MSCNGCRVLRRGCSEECILRQCLEGIQGQQAQGFATLFVSKFFGRSDLMSFISAVPENQRPDLFQSLLYEACGRAVNPVDGAVGLLSTGNWHICQAAVETVLAGGAIFPVPVGIPQPPVVEEAVPLTWGSYFDPMPKQKSVMHGSYVGFSGGGSRPSVSARLDCMEENVASLGSGVSELSPEIEKGDAGVGGGKKPKLLNLFG